MILSKLILLGVAAIVHESGAASSCTKWLDNSKICCIDTGLCSSSSCTVFGFKNSARTNCHTADANRNCPGAYCSYAGTPQCVPTPGSQVHCYGSVKCTDGTTSCDGYGLRCLDDGVSANFKICGDDSCPTTTDGTCVCPCGKERNSTLGDCIDIPAGPRKPCCGGCGPGAVCDDGVCVCECGKKNTAGTIDDGCEGDDPNVCCSGCGEGAVCDHGQCVCQCGRTNAPGTTIADGCELTNPDVCCPNNPTCGPNSYCENGQCKCKCGFADSNGDVNNRAATDGCETPLTNICCGGCKENEICRNGVCVCDCDMYPTGNPPMCKPPVECHVDVVKVVTNLTVDETPQALMLWKPGPEIQKGKGRGQHKGIDQAVGDFTVDYIESSNTFTLTFNLNNLEAWGYPTSFLKFKKVWPRLRARKPIKFDTKWLKEYAVENNATYVRFEGIQIPDFVCDKPGPKDLFLWTQLQYWIPNNGVKLGADGLPLDLSKMHYKAAHGYIQDGLSKTGRQRREYIVTVMCGGVSTEIITSGNCECNPSCTGTNEYCDLSSGKPTCECQDGFQRDPITDACLPDSCAELGPLCPDNSYCLERGVGNGPICKCSPGYHPVATNDGSLLCVRKCVFNGATALKAVGSTGGIIGKLDIDINDLSELSSPEVAFTWTLTDGQIRRISSHLGKEQWMSKHVPLMYEIQSILATGAGSYRYPAIGYLPLGQGPIDCSPGVENAFYVSSQLGYVTSAGASGKGHNRGRKSGGEESMAFEFRVKCLPSCPVAAKCHNCHSLAECVWDHGSSDDNKYKCKCSAGYQGNGVNGVTGVDGCFDENECLSGATAACGANTVCTNTAGSYTCACSTNRLIEDPKGGCCTGGASGCPTSMTPRDAETSTASPAAEAVVTAGDCAIPSWVWILIGVLTTLIFVSMTTVFVQHMLHKRREAPLFTAVTQAPRSDPTPAPSTATVFTSPSNVRQRHPGSQSVTPSGRENPAGANSAGSRTPKVYEPLQE